MGFNILRMSYCGSLRRDYLHAHRLVSTTPAELRLTQIWLRGYTSRLSSNRAGSLTARGSLRSNASTTNSRGIIGELVE